MDPTLIFALIVGAFFFLLFCGTPIFAALGTASIIGFLLHGGAGALETLPDILH